MRNLARKYSASESLWGRRQFRLLVLGAVLFLFWHVIEMAMTPNEGPRSASSTTQHATLEATIITEGHDKVVGELEEK
jgi:hypothetical protein